MLAIYITKQNSDFDEFLPFTSFCYNTSVNEMTAESFYVLMLSRGSRFAIEDLIRTETQLTYSDKNVDTNRRGLIQSLRNVWRLAYDFSQKAQWRMKVCMIATHVKLIFK